MRGLEEDFLGKQHRYMFDGVDKNGTIFRSLYYPPLTGSDVTEDGVVRCGEHSDYGTVTLLLQDDIGGLEVKKKNLNSFELFFFCFFFFKFISICYKIL